MQRNCNVDTAQRGRLGIDSIEALGRQPSWWMNQTIIKNTGERLYISRKEVSGRTLVGLW